TPVTQISKSSVHAGSREFSADWIVGADGHRSQVRRWAELESGKPASFRFAFRQHFACAPWTDFVEVHWGAKAQLYITPVSSGEVGVVVLSRNPQFRVKDALLHFPSVAVRLRACETTTAERGAATGNFVLPAVHAGRIALLGDASGTVDAITGEGLSLAFQQ